MRTDDIIILVMALVILLLILLKWARDGRAQQTWEQAVNRRLELIEQRLRLLRDDLEHRMAVMDKRVTVCERMLRGLDAPEPNGTIGDEEEDN